MTPHPDGCDHCGRVRELYHFDGTEPDNPLNGQSLCDACNTLGDKLDDALALLRVAREWKPLHVSLGALVSMRNYLRTGKMLTNITAGEDGSIVGVLADDRFAKFTPEGMHVNAGAGRLAEFVGRECIIGTFRP